MKNLCGKTVTRENAYEVWRAGNWTWYCLKKYQSEDKEAANKYARWFCLVVTPMCPNGELGDVYVKDIKSVARRIDRQEVASYVKGTHTSNCGCSACTVQRTNGKFTAPTLL